VPFKFCREGRRCQGGAIPSAGVDTTTSPRAAFPVSIASSVRYTTISYLPWFFFFFGVLLLVSHPDKVLFRPSVRLPAMPFLSDPQPRIIIAGAGIGGLSTALALHAAGFTDIHVFEASATLTTLGVGINVQPSAVLILRNLGKSPFPAVQRLSLRCVDSQKRPGSRS
jgi:hypothetical protein